jgi:hypothetical protein
LQARGFSVRAGWFLSDGCFSGATFARAACTQEAVEVASKSIRWPRDRQPYHETEGNAPVVGLYLWFELDGGRGMYQLLRLSHE